VRGTGLRAKMREWQRVAFNPFVPMSLIAVLLPIYLATANTSQAHVNDARAASVAAWSVGTRGTFYLPPEWSPSPAFWGVYSEAGGLVTNRFPGAFLWYAPAYAASSLQPGAVAPRSPFTVPIKPAALLAAATTAAAVALSAVAWDGLIGRRTAVALGLAVGLGTSTWTVAANSPWPHAPACLGVAALVLGWRRDSPSLSSLGTAVVILVRPHLAVATLIAALCMYRESRRSWLPTLLATSLALAATAVYSFLIFGEPLPVAGYATTSYAHNALLVSPGTTLRDVLATLFSPQNGVFVYSPFLLTLLPLVCRSWAKAPSWARQSAVAGVAGTILHVRLGGAMGGEGFHAYRIPLEGLFFTLPILAAGLARPSRGSVLRLAIAAAVIISFAAHARGIGANAIPDETRQYWMDLQESEG
jgi:hypothetical protein